MDSIKSATQAAQPQATRPTTGGAQAQAVAKASGTYESESMREIQARATHVLQDESAGERRGMRRLNEALATGQGLRQDVPRGFYLNINV